MRASGYERVADDWYLEPDWSVDGLLAVEPAFCGVIHDPCCGGGNIPRRLAAAGLHAVGSDLVDRGFGTAPVDFFASAWPSTSIVSNPPFDRPADFVRHALTLTTDRVAVLLKLAFLESQGRDAFFAETPLARIHVSRRRISMPPGGTNVPARGGTAAFARFVFEHGFAGKPTVDRF